MFSRLRTRLRKKLNILKEDNKGAAIVVAIVAIAFIGMLVGMLVYMAYYNYLMKHIDKRNKDNFILSKKYDILTTSKEVSYVL